MLVHGGHGFKTLEPVKMLEIKQGPFVSNKDKIKFDEIDEKKIMLSHATLSFEVFKMLQQKWIP